MIYVPTSHVTGHQADMLSIQLLHDSKLPQSEEEENQHRDQACWHGRATARIIHSQNITFIKTPGQNIKVAVVHSKSEIQMKNHDVAVAISCLSMGLYGRRSPLIDPICARKPLLISCHNNTPKGTKCPE